MYNEFEEETGLPFHIPKYLSLSIQEAKDKNGMISFCEAPDSDPSNNLPTGLHRKILYVPVDSRLTMTWLLLT